MIVVEGLVKSYRAKRVLHGIDHTQQRSETVVLIDKNYRAYLSFTGPDRVRYLNAVLAVTHTHLHISQNRPEDSDLAARIPN